ncbi:maltose ABC transporter permease MalF [Ideonella alba]|uniref:Maltose/maltodextrin transport system permease protein n=1 Tax=Ideonella alba TaxID=2824118 RepID=A0A940Y8G4_9BURK|nr:maltose ABC transporter permease MalF [Ideonella alba]MBQ0931837.1 maltose ABC transporter permease MalF [Ideonella alba]
MTPRRWTLAASVLAELTLLWLVTGMMRAGNPLWAVAVLVLGSSAIATYGLGRSLAWRYLYPGVVAMVVFIAFPLLYTVQIGFTNYSSNNLLTEERARAYLLEQAEVAMERALPYTAHRDADGQVRLVFTTRDGARLAATVPDQVPAAPLPLQPLAGEVGTALDLRALIAVRERLRPLKVALPEGAVLAYAGLREFAPFTPLWTAAENGALTQTGSGTRYTPDRDSGFFTAPDGTRLQPGFQVNVGWGNYQRLFGDPDMRGPFGSIFVWTVAFAGLTVLFSAAIGGTLAVVLNWEALKYRTLYRTLLFLPYAVPGFISILVFKGLFNQNFGEINAILDHLFGIKPAWFADPALARTMILIVNTWLGYPYFLVLCTGLIKAIPSDLYEASAIAGASPWVNFRRITLPLIIRPLTPLLISAFAFNFNNFVLISLLTDGRPDYLNTKLPAGTTDILVSYTYRIAFTDAGANFGLAAAISTVIFALVAVLSLLNLKLTQAQEGKR